MRNNQISLHKIRLVRDENETGFVVKHCRWSPFMVANENSAIVNIWIYTANAALIFVYQIFVSSERKNTIFLPNIDGSAKKFVGCDDSVKQIAAKSFLWSKKKR